MEILSPNVEALSPEEQKELEQLKTAIEKAIADSVLTKDERDHILAMMVKDRKIIPQELELIRTLIREKIESGSLVKDESWDI